ncbi:hypothetical protein AMTRI_Chr04g247730 [Amborella trichopoda]|uniref:uncharacterized protein LOC110006779 n=1 Tax=Amborella trichopoda TaxID=13333 RepID=UPI0009C052E5|nr:uncharacterized protein LOC110006779 [Amborella trichopoda]|eukprot:XP_020519543.1 uncharacterized protein LOC110006779 [Amborella trichopoda]
MGGLRKRALKEMYMTNKANLLEEKKITGIWRREGPLSFLVLSHAFVSSESDENGAILESYLRFSAIFRLGTNSSSSLLLPFLGSTSSPILQNRLDQKEERKCFSRHLIQSEAKSAF